MNFKVNFIPLSFINSEAEILNLIRNTFLFSSLFDKYEEVTLNHYLESTQYGFTASATDNGTHKLVRITDIKDGGVEWASVPFCNCENDVKYLLSDNDILIARTGGTTGKSFIVKDAPKNAVYASYLIRLRLKENVDINFITAYLNSYVFWSQIVELKAGSAMPNVNAEKLKTLRIPKCDFTTQKQLFNSNESTQEVQLKIQSIESIFGDNKLLLAELTHQLTLVKQLRQSFLREAMQGKLTADFRSAHPELIEGENCAQALLEKIKAEKKQLIKDGKLKKEKELSPVGEDEIPFEIPEGWVWCRLGEITNYGSSPKAEPADLKEDTWVLDLEDIEKESSKLIEKIRFKERNSLSTKSRFNVGDVLYSKLRPYLDKVIVADENGVCTTEILPLKCFAEMNPFFFRYSLKREDFLLYVNSVTKGMKMPRLGTKEGELALIPLPPLSEQQVIVSKLDELMRTCDELEASIRTSQQQNEMLLQQVLREALEGQIK